MTIEKICKEKTRLEETLKKEHEMLFCVARGIRADMLKAHYLHNYKEENCYSRSFQAIYNMIQDMGLAEEYDIFEGNLEEFMEQAYNR